MCKRIKKYVGFVVSVFLLTTILTGNVIHAQKIPEIVIGQYSGKPGDLVSIPINLKNIPLTGINSM